MYNADFYNFTQTIELPPQPQTGGGHDEGGSTGDPDSGNGNGGN